MRTILFAAAAIAMAAGHGLAEEPPSTPWIPTASAESDTAPEPASTPPATLPSPAREAKADEAPKIEPGPCGPEKVNPDGSLDKAPHGEVVAGVGTHGYNHQRITICKPLGPNASATTTVSRTQNGRGR